MPRGRPVKSLIRQRIVEILAAVGKSYGYRIYKIYRSVYPHVTQRVIYYHLRKGLLTGEFKIEKVQKEQGEYSWGAEAEKIYYTLGPQAQPRGDPKLREAHHAP